MHPILEKDRVTAIDMMRGFAILGIFLVNMLSFHSPFSYIDPLDWWRDPGDQAVYTFIDIFVQASFYPLFAMLFGYSFIILRERVLQKGLSFTPIAVRRFFFLLVLGLFHGFFIWFGDILAVYAVLAFLFLPLMNWSGKTLMITGTVGYLVINVLLGLLLLAAAKFIPTEEMSLYDPQLVQQAVQAYSNGSFIEVTMQRIADWYYVNNLASLPIMIISIYPLFLIGGGAAKLKIFERAAQIKKPLWIAAILTFTAGLLLKLLPYWTEANYGTEYFQDIIGGPLVAIAYGLFIALAAEHPRISKLFKPLSYVGRFSLSNYLLQSVICSLLFYSYGFALFGKISVVTGTVIVLIFYLLQIAASYWWAKHYQYGPVEWVLRCFTYGKLQKFKR